MITYEYKELIKSLMRGRLNMKVKKAIIPAAGLGTRFLPATKAQPKEMLPIVDKPTIQYIIKKQLRLELKKYLL